jgi:glycosyltransferase involved in cell wall biosynthesis
MTEQGRKLKILICLLYYIPHHTGLTVHVQQVAEELVRRGHQVTVLTARYLQDMTNDEITHNGVRVIRLWAPIKISRGMLMPSYPIAAYKAMCEADIVSIHTPMLETAMASFIAKLTGVNVIATHHGDLVLPEGRFNRFIRDTMLKLFQYMANNAAQLIAYSQDYAEYSYYLKPYLHKTTPNYPPISIPEPNIEHVAELRAQWQTNGGPIIGYSGRFVEEKRPELAIKALETINQHYPNTRLVFAGEYEIPYEDTWEKQQPVIEQYKEQLVFLGLLTDRQALADFYAACDVIILPSDTECFALVQVEAMLCGTPMVMTDIPGGRVPVTVTGMGKLAEQGNAHSIGQAVVDILNEPQKFHKSREYIANCFSFKQTVDTYESLFLKYARLARSG